MQDDYKVQLDIFEGPLDLLLYLTRKDEVDIHDISIDRIAKQYLSYMDSFRMLNIALASEFMVMAANLIYLKSRTLLPKHHQPPEDDAEDEDPRWDLIRQLIEYKKFKDAAGFLHAQAEQRLDYFANAPEDIADDRKAERPLAEVGIFDLIRAFQTVVRRFEESSSVGEIFDDRYTVSDKIDHLLATVPAGGNLRFSDLFKGAGSKGEVIVTFLALLELMKLNHFSIRQDTLMGEIELHRNQNL